MHLQDEKHYMTVTNWPKEVDESFTEDNMLNSRSLWTAYKS